MMSLDVGMRCVACLFDLDNFRTVQLHLAEAVHWAQHTLCPHSAPPRLCIGAVDRVVVILLSRLLPVLLKEWIRSD